MPRFIFLQTCVSDFTKKTLHGLNCYVFHYHYRYRFIEQSKLNVFVRCRPHLQHDDVNNNNNDDGVSTLSFPSPHEV